MSVKNMPDVGLMDTLVWICLWAKKKGLFHSFFHPSRPHQTRSTLKKTCPYQTWTRFCRRLKALFQIVYLLNDEFTLQMFYSCSCFHARWSFFPPWNQTPFTFLHILAHVCFLWCCRLLNGESSCSVILSITRTSVCLSARLSVWGRLTMMKLLGFHKN